MNGFVELDDVMDSFSLPRHPRRNPMTREHVKGKETHMTTRVSIIVGMVI